MNSFFVTSSDPINGVQNWLSLSNSKNNLQGIGNPNMLLKLSSLYHKTYH